MVLARGHLFEDLVSRKWLQRLVKVAQSSRPEVRPGRVPRTALRGTGPAGAYLVRLLTAWNEQWAAFMKKGQADDMADALRRMAAVR